MADITFSTTFVSGSTPSGSEVSKNFYDPVGGDNSFETINGGLDQANRSAFLDIVRRDVQVGTFSGGKMVGRTVNLDYFVRFFAGFDVSVPETFEAYLAIPGCAQTFYLKYLTPVVIFSWSLMVAHDGDEGGPAQEMFVQLFVDGVRVTHSLRRIPASMGQVSVGVEGRWGKERDRVISGHHVVPDMAVGWHNVSVRIAGSARHSRVRCGSMRYIYFQ